MVVGRGLALALVFSVGCQVSGGSGGRPASAPPPSYAPSPTPIPVAVGAPGNAATPPSAASRAAAAATRARAPIGIARAEMHHPGSIRSHGAAFLFLPGARFQQLVNYQVTDDGMAVYEGDILLGPASTVVFRYGVPHAPPANVHGAVTLADTSNLWPNGEIPFAIDSSVPPDQVQAINEGIQMVNQTPLRVRPRGPSDRDFLVFRDPGGGSGCSSFIGRVGGPQDVIVDDCVGGSVAHEILHAAGFFHEQSRGDRDDFITVVFDEIDPAFRTDFEKRDNRGQDIGPYDYGSVMHYPSTAFSRTGRPTIIPKQRGARIGQRDNLSPLDREAVAVLYGVAPTASPTPGAPGVPPPSQPSQPAQQPTPPAQPPPPTLPPPSTTAPSGSVAGNYTSQRGNVACAQNGGSVSCQYPGGVLFCTMNAATLDCTWAGGGQGLARFQRQANGVLAGTFGDFLSNASRGAWDLVPASAAAAPSAPPPVAPAPAPAPAQGPAPGGAASLTGNYGSSRGPMSCVENGQFVTCSFQEQGAAGRLDCAKDASGLSLSCTWLTLPPRPGSGRAAFTRSSAGDRNLTGTFGLFLASSGAGTWNAQPQ